MAYLKQIPTSIVTWVVAILAALSAIPCAAASPQYPSTDAIDVKDVLEVAQESASIFEVDAPGSEALVPFKAAPTPTAIPLRRRCHQLNFNGKQMNR
jgi:hypothetical protein